MIKKHKFRQETINFNEKNNWNVPPLKCDKKLTGVKYVYLVFTVNSFKYLFLKEHKKHVSMRDQTANIHV